MLGQGRLRRIVNPVFADDEDDLSELAEEVLAEYGPMTIPELVEALERGGGDLGSEPEEDLADALSEGDGDAVPLLDGRWAYAPALLEGRVFTHRLTAAEVEHDVLTVQPDLLPALAGEAPRLVDGERLSLTLPPALTGRPAPRDLPPDVIHMGGSLVLPPGLLSGTGAGPDDLVGLTVTPVGVDVRRVDASAVTGDPGPIQDALLDLVNASPEDPCDLDPALWTVCADQPDAFRDPVPPVAELLSGASLAHRGNLIAPLGFDFDLHRVEQQVAEVTEEYDLSADEALAVVGLVRIFDDMSLVLREEAAQLPDGEEADETEPAPVEPAPAHARMVAATVPFLTDPRVAYAFLAETIGDGFGGAAALGLMAETLEQQSVRSARHPLLWLRAKACERLGLVTDAEESLRAAERLDPEWYPTLVDLARYASDRGDAERGLALLRRAGENADPGLREVLEAFRQQPGPTLGRNDPCWCGSGRKFKQCHLHRSTAYSLAERTRWLYHKAASFAAEGPLLDLRFRVALERAAYAEGDTETKRAALDPLVTDAVLFEGGAFERFLKVRGQLLPDDERLLAEQWLLVDRSAFEVTEVRRGQGFTARDLRTGGVHAVRDRLASVSLRPKDLICARIVPAGDDTVQVFGGIEPVPLHQRDALLALLDSEPDPEELVAFLTSRFAPPSLTNTEGETLVINEVVLDVPDQAALTAALDRRYRRLEDTEVPQWLDERAIEGMDRIRATLRLTGQGLRVSTNSDARMEDVLAQVAELHPGVSVASRERTPMSTTREAIRLAQQRPSTGIGPLGIDQQAPEVQQALAAHMADYERRWLDMSIPALRGLTPREAADDPTRREDLVSLLASFPDTGSPAQMSAARLRKALGLD